MDLASIGLIFALIKEVTDLAPEIANLMDRVQNGESITQEEIKAARKEVDAAVEKWNES